MNNITKENVAEKVILALSSEKMMNVEAAKHFGIHPAYLSMIRKHEQFERCPESAWTKMREWIYSGKSIKEYAATEAPELPAEPEQAAPPPAPKKNWRKEFEAPAPAVPIPTERVIKITKTFVDANAINRRLAEVRKEKKAAEKGKPKKEKGLKVKGDDGAARKELIDEIIASIGLEIDVIIKLKK